MRTNPHFSHLCIGGIVTQESPLFKTNTTTLYWGNICTRILLLFPYWGNTHLRRNPHFSKQYYVKHLHEKQDPWHNSKKTRHNHPRAAHKPLPCLRQEEEKKEEKQREHSQSARHNGAKGSARLTPPPQPSGSPLPFLAKKSRKINIIRGFSSKKCGDSAGVLSKNLYSSRAVLSQS